jgi:hypothetical protein
MTTFCPNTALFGPDRKHCVAQHLADLSKPCLSAISAILVEMESLHPHMAQGVGPLDPSMMMGGGMGPMGPGGMMGPGGGGPGGMPWWGGDGGRPMGGFGGPGGGPGGPRLCLMVGAGVAGGSFVLLAGLLLHFVRRAACRGRGCRRGCCGGPQPPFDPSANGPPPPGWQGYHIAQPVTGGDAPLPAVAGSGGRLYPAPAATTGGLYPNPAPRRPDGYSEF